MSYMKKYYDWLDEAMRSDYEEDLGYLKEFWDEGAPLRKVRKEFETLTYFEILQLKRDYEEDQEQRLNPERFYMTGGI